MLSAAILTNFLPMCLCVFVIGVRPLCCLQVKIFHNDGEGANDRSAERRARNQIGTYVRVFGNVGIGSVSCCCSMFDDRQHEADDTTVCTVVFSFSCVLLTYESMCLLYSFCRGITDPGCLCGVVLACAVLTIVWGLSICCRARTRRITLMPYRVCRHLPG